MAKRGPKFKFSRTRDAAALFQASRGQLGYRRAMADVSALLGVPSRNIEREIKEETTVLSPEFEQQNALYAIAANVGIIRANLRNRTVEGIEDWPDPYRKALAQLIPGE